MSTSSQQEYISVVVRNPTIHSTYEDGRYTTFEVVLQTNSLSFTTKHSVVQRRYSDFVWLRKALARTTHGSPPSLPFGRIWGLFDEKYLLNRQTILTDFMQKIVRDTFFVSSTALHLFLQTDLNRDAMDYLVKEARRRGSMNSIERAIGIYGTKNSAVPRSLSIASLKIGGTKQSPHSNSLTVSRSVPAFGPNSCSLNNRNSSAGSFPTAENLENSPSMSESSSADESVYSDTPSRIQGNSLRIDNNNECETDGWVIINSPVSSYPTGFFGNKEVDFDAINAEVDRTKVLWDVGAKSGSSESLPQSAHRYDEATMSNFIHNQSTPVAAPSGSACRNGFKARSLGSAINTDYYEKDIRNKSLSNRDLLGAEDATKVRRVQSDRNMSGKREAETYAEPLFSNSSLSRKKDRELTETALKSFSDQNDPDQLQHKILHKSLPETSLPADDSLTIDEEERESDDHPKQCVLASTNKEDAPASVDETSSSDCGENTTENAAASSPPTSDNDEEKSCEGIHTEEETSILDQSSHSSSSEPKETSETQDDIQTDLKSISIGERLEVVQESQLAISQSPQAESEIKSRDESN